MKCCECGCGNPAPIAKFTARSRGWVKGQPKRFIRGHQPKVPMTPERLAKMNAARQPLSAEARQRISDSKKGELHPLWRGDQANYSTIHHWLRRNFPKAGRCEWCGFEGRTEYAFLNGGREVTRDRADYVEICRSCHVRHDWKFRRAAARDTVEHEHSSRHADHE